MTRSKSCDSKQVQGSLFSQSKWSGLIYNTKENYNKFDSMLKDIDEEYRTTLIYFGKYKLVMFAMAKLMEMDTSEQNKVALYLYNNAIQICVEKLCKLWYNKIVTIRSYANYNKNSKLFNSLKTIVRRKTL